MGDRYRGATVTGPRNGVRTMRDGAHQSGADEQIEPAPEFGSQVGTEFILGMGKVGESVKILLDIDCVPGSEERTAAAPIAVG